VAAKILKGSNDIALGDFRGEIEILRRVHHPNAVQFLGACTKREPYILVTELMSGGSLADAFRRTEAFPFRRAVEIALDAARGLAYLHNRRPQPIIHRDLKSPNLLVGKDWTVKVSGWQMVGRPGCAASSQLHSKGPAAQQPRPPACRRWPTST